VLLKRSNTPGAWPGAGLGQASDQAQGAAASTATKEPP